LRSVADRMEAFAVELDGASPRGSVTTRAGAQLAQVGSGKYVGMTQSAAILEALVAGPQTTAELFERLNAGGQCFKKRTYVTALLGRLKDQVERAPDGKVQLKAKTA